ncbi:MAG TPA: DUF1365 family protein, partial [Candidatus Omnitrophota bacterium]|nr:DUF1365 family protein [Candidatus Omnitrophota bacterium]
YLSDITENLDIRINYMREKKIFFTAHLEGRGTPLSSNTLLKTILSMPLRALLSLPLIHIQAMRLFFLKKLKIIGRPHARGPYVLLETRERAVDSFFIKKFMAVMSAIDRGRLEIHMPDGRIFTFGKGDGGPKAEMSVHNYWFFIKTGLFGDVGFGDSYMEGIWDTPDLLGLLELFVINMKPLEKKMRSLRRLNFLSRPRVNKINANTIDQAKENIKSHYDLSNDFFKLFLDERMMYSSAVFTSKNETLEAAQINKIHSLIKKAGITGKDHVLEIGSGWGGFAREAALSTGCRVTTITVSNEQYEYVRKLVDREGLSDRIDVKLCDYREITGIYDKIVSIEMIEAVGHENIPVFFKKCDGLLKPGGILVIQAIAIPDEKYDDYRKNHDWIREHIFPGGMLPSLEIIKTSTSRDTRLVITDIEDIALSYALTLREWRKRLYANKAELFKLGFDEVFFRKWGYYLSYSEAALGQRAISDLQIVFNKGRSTEEGIS